LEKTCCNFDEREMEKKKRRELVRKKISEGKEIKEELREKRNSRQGVERKINKRGVERKIN